MLARTQPVRLSALLLAECGEGVFDARAFKTFALSISLLLSQMINGISLPLHLLSLCLCLSFSQI